MDEHGEKVGVVYVSTRRSIANHVVSADGSRQHHINPFIHSFAVKKIAESQDQGQAGMHKLICPLSPKRPIIAASRKRECLFKCVKGTSKVRVDTHKLCPTL